jgi:hypothetical protein
VLPSAADVEMNEHERGIIQTLRAFLSRKQPEPLCLYHFLVHDNVVYVIDRESWWHSIGHKASKLAECLVSEGATVVRVEVIHSSNGWRPYFARSKQEEPGCGWNEPTIRLLPRNLDWLLPMEQAWQAWRSFKEEARRH